jgi:hypothetical protein
LCVIYQFELQSSPTIGWHEDCWQHDGLAQEHVAASRRGAPMPDATVLAQVLVRGRDRISAGVTWWRAVDGEGEGT